MMKVNTSSRVLGIGMDLVDVDRIAKAIERQGSAFLSRVFTALEREYCEGKANAAQHFAVRFAAKEAVSKAFGTGIGSEIGFLDIELKNQTSGAPRIILHGKGRLLAESRGVSEVLVSLSHTQQVAGASVVLQ
jgi:holo-[acyl-carrier protein] synthase